MTDKAQADARDVALRRHGTLDSASSLGLDKVARLAAFVAGSRFAAVHLLDGTHQHRVAQSGGLPRARTPVEDSMCLPVVEAQTRYYAADASTDDVYKDNPNVAGPDPVRFFAACPVRSDTGVPIGTLCVFDHIRIELDDERLRLLDDLAEHVREHLALHSQIRLLGHAATHDDLTGLPNRALLSDRLAHAMNRRGRKTDEPALALIDLDGFKTTNDMYGHQAGDAVLVEIGLRLLKAVRVEDTVARLGGDEFVVLYDQFPDGQDGDAVERILRSRLTAVFAEPVVVDFASLDVAASIGFVRARPAELGYALLGRADEAMYAHKSRPGRTGGPLPAPSAGS